MDDKDFGIDFLKFFPERPAPDTDGERYRGQVQIDGWYTAAQLRNIANELDRLEAELPGGVDPEEG